MATAIASAVHEIIDDMWGDELPPTDLVASARLRLADGRAVVRGDASPRDCVIFAARAYRAADHEEAIAWLRLGAAHDPLLDERIRSQPGTALDVLARDYLRAARRAR